MDRTILSRLRQDDLAKLILRLGIGPMMLLHGVAKVRTGVDGIAGMFESKGLPGALAYGAYLGEVVAPLLLILGFATRAAAAVIVFTMLTAIALAHSADILKLNPQHGGWMIELPMLYLVGALALVFTGAGTYSVSRGKGPLD